MSTPDDYDRRVNALMVIGDEIQEIMATYREQEKTAWGVDTPGGLEHMGDVWKLLREWDDKLLAAAQPMDPVDPAKGGE